MSEVRDGAEILVVDDDAELRALASRALQRHGCRVQTAGSGAEALALDLDGFDAILCDVTMPGMSGLELLRQVKARHPLIEFVMATGAATPEGAVEAMRLDAYDFVSKPYELGPLCRLLLDAAARTRSRRDGLSGS